MSTLSADERALFDRGYLQCEKRALRVARKRGAEDPCEILNAAMLRMIEGVTRDTDPRPMPACEQAFGDEFVREVRYIAMSTVRGNSRYTAPIHSHWGAAPAPVTRRKLSERLLCHDFENIDDYDQSAAVDDFDVDEPLPLPKHRGPCWPKVDRDRMQAELELIVADVMVQLSAMQSDVVQMQLAGMEREAGASILGISVKTFDIHWSRAKKRMRVLLLQGTWRFPDPSFADNREWPSDWNAIILSRYLRQAHRNRASLAKRSAALWTELCAEQGRANAAEAGPDEEYDEMLKAA